MSKHQEGLAKVIQQILSPILHKLIDFEEYGLATLTHIEVTKDFDYADVSVSVFKNQDQLKYLLRGNVYKIQQELNKKIARKTVPKIRFFVDTSGEYAEKIERMFRD